MQTGLWGCGWCILFIDDGCEVAQSTVNVDMPGQVVLAFKRKQIEDTMGSKTASSIPPWVSFSYNIQHPAWFPLLIDCKLQLE